MLLCVHCGTREKYERRGLCQKCYKDHEIRGRYPLPPLERKPICMPKPLIPALTHTPTPSRMLGTKLDDVEHALKVHRQLVRLARDLLRQRKADYLALKEVYERELDKEARQETPLSLVS